MNIGFTEIIVLLVLFLLLFGAKKLPELARSMGKSVHEFKKGLKEGHDDSEAEGQKKIDSSPNEKKNSL